MAEDSSKTPLIGGDVDHDQSESLDRFPLNGRGGYYNGGGGAIQQIKHVVRGALTEFVATTFFVMVGVTAVRNNASDDGVVDLVAIALAHGLMIFLLVSITGHVRCVDLLSMWRKVYSLVQ